MGDIADLVKDIREGSKVGLAVQGIDLLEAAVSTIANLSSVVTLTMTPGGA